MSTSILLTASLSLPLIFTARPGSPSPDARLLQLAKTHSKNPPSMSAWPPRVCFSTGWWSASSFSVNPAPAVGWSKQTQRRQR
jgi:hypothetical protein